MKILISSLQVTQGASKGHLHPAIEIGLELKARGHHIAILPLPSPFSEEDRQQIIHCGFEILEPPTLPETILLTPNKLAQLAKNSSSTAEAYQAFLVTPLDYQFEPLLQMIQEFAPAIIVYDLLVYAAPLAARLLNIPDMGYCAGLKLIAPDSLTTIYQSIRLEIAPTLEKFLNKHSLSADFHHLELLSSTYQLVFTPEEFIKSQRFHPKNTILVGSLGMSHSRCNDIDFNLDDVEANNIIFCFGSVYDPANYPNITTIVIKLAETFKRPLIICSRQLDMASSPRVKVASYLPLPTLLKNTSMWIHHGGANSFSEALTLGVPQLLIPLAVDQPIQAELLRESQAGIAIHPENVTEEVMSAAFERLLNPDDPLHLRRQAMKDLFAASQGAVVASNYIENIAKENVDYAGPR